MNSSKFSMGYIYTINMKIALKAIILVAGIGSRLRPLTENKPKCLVEFGGKTILERLQKNFFDCGITDITLVVGYGKNQLNIKNFNVIENHEYNNSGIMHSLFNAKEKFTDDIIISYGDIIFEKEVLEKLIESKENITAVIDKEWEKYWKIRTDDPLSDAESLIIDKNNYVLNIGEKNLKEIKDVAGQFIGLIKFQNDGVKHLKEFFEQLYKKNLEKNIPIYGNIPFKQSTLTNFLQIMIENNHKIKACFIENGWLEFDTVDDYNLYNKMYDKKILSKFIKI
jgi:phosphoenolpyruvate phosphomutase